MRADGMLATRSHARISASPASRAATRNLTDFIGTLYPPIGGPALSGWSRSALGQTQSFGDVGSMSGLPESGHGWAIYEYAP